MQVHSELKGGQLENKESKQAFSGNQVGLMQFNTTDNKVQITHNSDVQDMATEQYVNTKASELSELKNAEYVDLEIRPDLPPIAETAVEAGKVRLKYETTNGLTLQKHNESSNQIAMKSDIGIKEYGNPQYTFINVPNSGGNLVKIFTAQEHSIFIINSVNRNTSSITKVLFQKGNESANPYTHDLPISKNTPIGQMFFLKPTQEIYMGALAGSAGESVQLDIAIINLNSNLFQ